MREKTEMLVSKYDGIPLSVLVTEPDEGCRGVLQISHGMCENKERYLPFMRFMAEQGYASVIHDHRGHGKSVRENRDLGYFYHSKEKGIVQDLYQITRWTKEQFPGIPLSMLGHSMGTFVARCYLKEHDDELCRLILTGPPSFNSAVDAGLFAAWLERKIYGEHHRSKLIQAMAFGPYALKFPQEKSPSAWISSDPEVVKAYDASEYCGFLFTTDGFKSLFCLMKETYKKSGWKMKNPDLPILFLGGEEDPCIGDEKKFEYQMEFLISLGYLQVTGKRYPGMRHEILNEREKHQVFEKISEYLEK